MKIKKKNTTIPISGKIVDTENVEDKTSNAPSMRLAGEMIKTIGEDKIKFKTATWNKSVSLSMPIRRIWNRINGDFISICLVEKWCRFFI